jgi:hypothetical protein
MTRSSQRETRVFTVLPRRGDQSKFDITEIAGELAMSRCSEMMAGDVVQNFR